MLADGVDLSSTDPATTACAIRALDPLVADASVVCLAESSHGTTQSPQMHALLLQHLVVDLGFRTVLFEHSDADLRALGGFVNDGDEAALATYLGRVKGTLASTEDASQMIRALATARAMLPAGERIRMGGIDVAIVQGATREALVTYLEKVAPDSAVEWEAKLKTTDHAAGESHSKELMALLASARSDYVARSSEAEYELATHDAESLAEGFAFLRLYAANQFIDGNADIRDPAMARNVLRQTEAGGKVAILAHFGHCAKNFPSQGKSEADGKFAFGKAVTTALGARYRVLAHLYGSGSERASSGKETSYKTSKGSLDAALDAVDASPLMLYPTHGAVPIDLDRRWPLTRMPEAEVVLAEQADALLYIDSPTAATF